MSESPPALALVNVREAFGAGQALRGVSRELRATPVIWFELSSEPEVMPRRTTV
jgi:hypothetical protein